MATATKVQPKATAQRVSAQELAAFLATRACPLAIDTETTGLDWQSDSLVTIQLGDARTVLIYDARSMGEHDRSLLAAAFADVARRGVEIIGHNLKFDVLFLRAAFGVRFLVVRDTMLQEQVLLGGSLGAVLASQSAEDDAEDSDSEAGENDYKVLHGAALEATVARYGLAMNKALQTSFLTLADGPLTPAHLAYIAADVRIPYQIAAIQTELIAQAGLAQVNKIEQAALPGIVDMEWYGMAVDVAGWRAYLAREQERADALEAEIQAVLFPAWGAARLAQSEQETRALTAWRAERDAYKASLTTKAAKTKEAGLWDSAETAQPQAKALSKAEKDAAYLAWRKAHPQPAQPIKAPEKINLASSVQVREALACMGIHTPSTDRKHLSLCYRNAPLDSEARTILAALMEWKGKNKLISAFGETVLARVSERGRIHPDFWQIGARTGRMSCHAPNWQQLPRPGGEDDDTIRRHVVAGPGNVLCIADYSNIELRILAEISQDENMLRLFAEGADLHTATARFMFGLAEDADPKKMHLTETKTYRDAGKTINFGIVYGMGPSKLADSLGVTLEKAKELMQAYFAAYPGVRRWLENAATLAMRRGYSVTLAGRRRYYRLSAAAQSDPAQAMMERSLMERQAKNSPIQGTSADISKLAIALLARDLPGSAWLVNAVHDEIIVECPQAEAEAIGALLARDMQRAAAVYLRTVDNPLPDVTVAPYWQKG